MPDDGAPSLEGVRRVTCPGLLVLADHGAVFVDGLSREARHGAGVVLSGRFEAGEELAPGRLAALDGGVVRPWASGLGRVLGTVLARRTGKAWQAGEFPIVLRVGTATIDLDGEPGDDLSRARVLAGGRFSATTGTPVSDAVFFAGALELNLR